MQAYSKTCIFFVKQYTDCQKQSVGGAVKVLAKSLKTIFDADHAILNLLQICIKFQSKMGRWLGTLAMLFIL